MSVNLNSVVSSVFLRLNTIKEASNKARREVTRDKWRPEAASKSQNYAYRSEALKALEGLEDAESAMQRNRILRGRRMRLNKSDTDLSRALRLSAGQSEIRSRGQVLSDLRNEMGNRSRNHGGVLAYRNLLKQRLGLQNAGAVADVADILTSPAAVLTSSPTSVGGKAGLFGNVLTKLRGYGQLLR